MTLEPLSQEHHDGLVEAARDGDLQDLWYTSVPRPEGKRAEIDRRVGLREAGTMLAFTARRNDTGRIVGTTTYMISTQPIGASRSGRRGLPAPRNAPPPTRRASCFC